MKKISEILSVKFQFFVIKFSIYLNRHVFIMTIINTCSWIYKFTLLSISVKWFCTLAIKKVEGTLNTRSCLNAIQSSRQCNNGSLTKESHFFSLPNRNQTVEEIVSTNT